MGLKTGSLTNVDVQEIFEAGDIFEKKEEFFCGEDFKLSLLKTLSESFYRYECCEGRFKLNGCQLFM